MKRLVAGGALAAVALLATSTVLHDPATVVVEGSSMARWASWSLLVLAALVAGLAPSKPIERVSILVVVGALLAVDWFGPGVSSGLVLAAAVAASGSTAGLLAASAAAGMPSSRTRTKLVWAASASAVLGAAVMVLAVDPRRSGCFACASNPLALADRPGLVHRFGLVLAGCAAVIGLAAVVVTADRVARRQGRVTDLAVPACGLVAAALMAASMTERGADTMVTGGWRVVLSAVVALMSAAIWIPRLVEVRDRRALLALVHRAAAGPAGDIESSLRSVTRDSGLRLCYVTDDGALVNPAGDPVAAPTGTSIDVERGGRRIAVLAPSGEAGVNEHVLHDAAVIAGAGLAHEREAAVLSARTKALAAARRAAIERGDLERRRLERELHDHAQQRLASIMIELRRAANRQPASERLEAAHEHVGRALEQVRAIAHGIYPTGLAEEGLAAALEELSWRTSEHIAVRTPSMHQADPIVDTTAYLVVAGYVDHAHQGATEISVQLAGDHVAISGRGRSVGEHELSGLRARTLALGGEWTDGDDVLEVVLPCGS